jgi:prepilin-type N-terminal cleavage/methylation domain-containing protein
MQLFSLPRIKQRESLAVIQRHTNRRIKSRVQRFSRGFTLIELVVTVALMAIVASVIYTPFLKNEVGQRRTDVTLSETQAIVDAAHVYYESNKTWPGAPGCSTAIVVLTSGSFLQNVDAVNAWGKSISTSCTASQFTISQTLNKDWAPQWRDRNSCGYTRVATSAR